jgi:hypothetical protein
MYGSRESLSEPVVTAPAAVRARAGDDGPDAREIAAPTLGDRPGARLRRALPPLLLAGGLLAAAVALHVRDPHDAGSWGLCPLRALTGLACPGCGGLRAVNDLTHGHLAAAASSNLLFVASLPALGWLWLRSVTQRWRGLARPLSPAVVRVAGVCAVVLAVTFGVVRNLPGMGWLLP